MFFSTAKFFGYFVTLPNAVVFAVALSTLALWTRYRRAARAAATASAIVLAVCALSPFPSILLRPLEDRFPSRTQGIPAASDNSKPSGPRFTPSRRVTERTSGTES